MESAEGHNNLHLSFAVIDTLNSCSWCGRVEGGAKSYEEAGNCFGVMLLEGVISWGTEYGWGYQFGGEGCRGQGRV